MKIQAGIKLLMEIEGYGEPIQDCDRYEAVLKFYRNKGDPLEFETVLQESIPCVGELNGKQVIAWGPTKMHRSNVVFHRYARLARQDHLLPGIYYSILGMKTMGYRHVAIPPHLYSHTMHALHGIDRESVIKLEIFLLRIYPETIAPADAPPKAGAAVTADEAPPTLEPPTPA